jgi:hypothetical protein
VIIGYFDESGTHESALVTTVGGFAATPAGWEAFDRDWTRILHEWQISVLHMKEFAHFRGEFERFKNDEPGRRVFLTKLLACILARCQYACAVSVIVEDHRLAHVDPRIGSAYALATKGCALLLDQWARENEREPPIMMVLASGSPFSTELMRHLDAQERPLGSLNDFGPIGFGTPREQTGIQAADLLAYEQGKYLTQCVKNDRAVRPRFPYSLLQALPHDWQLFDLHTIADLLITTVMSDLQHGGIKAVRQRHPNAKTTIDGHEIDTFGSDPD